MKMFAKLDAGQIKRYGTNVAEIVAEYMDFQRKRATGGCSGPAPSLDAHDAAGRTQSNSPRIGRVESVALLDSAGRAVQSVERWTPLTVRITYLLERHVKDCVLGVAFFDTEKRMLSGLNTMVDGAPVGNTPGWRLGRFRVGQRTITA